MHCGKHLGDYGLPQATTQRQSFEVCNEELHSRRNEAAFQVEKEHHQLNACVFHQLHNAITEVAFSL